MADLPISALPQVTVVTPADPMAIVTGGITSRASVNVLLTAFTANTTKPLPNLTDEVMIFDGSLLKASVSGILISFTNSSTKTNVDPSDEVMIYDGSLLKTTVNDILEAFTEATFTNNLNLTDQVMIWDNTILRTDVLSVLFTFNDATAKSPAEPDDKIMTSIGNFLHVSTINDALTAFDANSLKSSLVGDETVMIYDPNTSELLKTTINNIVGNIVSPLNYLYYYIESNMDEGNYRVRNVGASGSINITFAFPVDMTALLEVNLILTPDGSSGAGKSIQFNSSFGDPNSGQTVTDASGSALLSFTFPADGTFFKLPVTSLFLASGSATRDAMGGDVAGLMIDHQGVGGATDYFKLELVYEAPGGSGSNVLVIDNLNSTSAVDALSANQGRVLDVNKQDIATLQTAIEAINFDGLIVVDPPTAPNDVANKQYVDDSSGGITVIDNLTSTSTTDALSANQGRVLNVNKQEISTLQTDIEALNFNDLTVVNTPTNPNDVTNKNYVDSNNTPVIDNLTSTSTTDALSANQGRVLNVNKQEISTLQSDIESINFDDLTVVNAPVAATDVANKDYVDNSSGGITVIDNLTSTSTTDALSANQGRVLNTTKVDSTDVISIVENTAFSGIEVTAVSGAANAVTNKNYVDTNLAFKQDISSLQSTIEAENFNSLTVVNVPLAATDVANKSYVDSSSGGIIVIDNLTSTSTTDALSANQGRILNINKQEIATLQTDIEALSFSKLTVTDPPISATDVANKSYVDSSSGSSVIRERVFYPVCDPDTQLGANGNIYYGKSVGSTGFAIMQGVWPTSIIQIFEARMSYLTISGSGPININYTYSQNADGGNTASNQTTGSGLLGISAVDIFREQNVVSVFNDPSNLPINGNFFAFKFLNLSGSANVGVTGLMVEYTRNADP